MSHFSKDFIEFFNDLERNNNREWFNENKERYKNSVQQPFEDFIQDILIRIQHDDPLITSTPKECIFRIYRDVRFSKNKEPYKTHASAIISPGGRGDFTTPGYYFEFSNHAVKFYGGAHFLEKDQLQRLREFIVQNLSEFQNLIKEKEFKKRFGEIQGEKHKRLPKEFKDLAESFPLIANKQFYVFAKLPCEKIISRNFTELIMKHYYAVKPFILFFRKALA
ncbi:MAG: DUF2461 domain-containing protein [Melioribacteraceae bacterium]|nr:DUF2461 domain-containing protein [Melioribacteraceae bacterium]MCF8354209.1 DUF2461 domain-containing protein [Melioribacteraceae bacterium]MCF8392855.1 DUF2461 domain-containing protein [Melioribacteraceae bacterium]MCF8418659.1 DUF2461 domain-containing protein [Melioribacteraceae bacterium]